MVEFYDYEFGEQEDYDNRLLISSNHGYSFLSIIRELESRE